MAMSKESSWDLFSSEIFGIFFFIFSPRRMPNQRDFLPEFIFNRQ